MGQIKSLERCLQKNETLKKLYQESKDTKGGYVRKIERTELNETKYKLQWYLTLHPAVNPHEPEKLEDYATQQQNVTALTLTTNIFLHQTCCRAYSEFLLLPRTPHNFIS